MVHINTKLQQISNHLQHYLICNLTTRRCILAPSGAGIAFCCTKYSSAVSLLLSSTSALHCFLNNDCMTARRSTFSLQQHICNGVRPSPSTEFGLAPLASKVS